jgi:hypothetical protein
MENTNNGKRNIFQDRSLNVGFFFHLNVYFYNYKPEDFKMKQKIYASPTNVLDPCFLYFKDITSAV